MTATLMTYFEFGNPGRERILLLNNGTHRATLDDADLAPWVRDAVNAYTGTEPAVNDWTEVDALEINFLSVVDHGTWLVDDGVPKIWIPGTDTSLLSAINAYTG